MNSTTKLVSLIGVSGAVVAIALYVLFNSPGTTIGTADADNPQLVALGKKVYAENCASCHGVNLEGQKNWRQQLPEGGLPAPPHDQSGHTWHHPDQLLFDYTKRGGQAIAPKGFKSNMPGFGSVLSDKKISASLAFIKSKWPLKIRRRHVDLNKRSLPK